MYMYVYSKKRFPDVTTVARGAHVVIMRGMVLQTPLFKQAKEKKKNSSFAHVMFILSHSRRRKRKRNMNLMNRHIAKRNSLSSFILSLSLNIL